VVDDEASNVEALIRILNRAGFRHVKGTTDSRSVLQLLEDHNPDLILLDLHMPNMDGFAVLTQLRAAIPSDCYLPDPHAHRRRQRSDETTGAFDGSQGFPRQAV
jgi:putative two-component system response regulator